MRKREIFSTFILLITVIILIGIIGALGYTIYKEIVGEGRIEISFVGEAGYPTIEYIPPKEENTDTNINLENFEVLGQETENTNVEEEKKYRHLYNQLDQTAKIIYTKLYENRENLKTGTYSIEFGNTFYNVLSMEKGDDELQRQYQSAIEALIYENPEIFYLDATNMYLNIEKITKITGVKYNVYINQGTKISYLAEGFYTKEDVEKCEAEIEQIKNNIVASVQGKSDYEKIKYIHDYLIDNIEYDSTLLADNIYNLYGALVSKKCVCEGYAKAFQYLMNEVGIDNAIVIGTATNSNNETENHAWNYVNFNGNWYAVDVTWDDPIIVGGGKLSKKSRYQYFLKGSNTIYKNHTPSGKFTEGGQLFTYPTLSVGDYE